MGKSLGDLNNHLFEALERLGRKELNGQELSEEIRRSDAITSLAEQVISNASLVLKAKTAQDNFIGAESSLPKMLEANDG